MRVSRWAGYEGNDMIVESADGPYVLHSDHLAAVEEARMAAFMEAKSKFSRITANEYGEKYGGDLEGAADDFFDWLCARCAEGLGGAWLCSE